MRAWNSTFKAKQSSLKRSQIENRKPEPKMKSLAMRVAEACGTAINHKCKEPSVFRSEQHRRNVAALPCLSCGAQKRSQAAHLNFAALGKGMGIKLSDALCVPLCADSLGRRGCHSLLDQGGVYDKATAKTLQLKWLHQTRDELKAQGKWPEAAEADVVRLVGEYLRRQM